MPRVFSRRVPHFFALQPNIAPEIFSPSIARLVRLIPQLQLRKLPAILLVTGCSALLAGFYGVAHDQITYSLSPEYFTRLKFAQFAYADFELPPRLFAGIIGFLATWWVGLIAGWFVARGIFLRAAGPQARALLYSSVLFILGSAALFALLGGTLAALGGYDHAAWERSLRSLSVENIPAFVTVAYIHNGSYLGGLAGLICTLFRNHRKTQSTSEPHIPSSVNP